MEQCREFLSAGERVVATLHLPAAAPAPGVVVCHGFTGHRIEAHFLFVKAARALCAAGLAVLRFDFRGSGESAGSFRDMTISGEIADALAALEFMRAEPAVDPERIALLGLSLGGLVAACAAARDGGVSALVLWSAVAHLERLFERLLPEFGEAPVLDYQGWGLGRAFLEELPQIQPLETVTGFAGPGLVVHGTRDESVPPSDGKDYHKVLGDRCRLHLVQGADHTFSSLAWQEEAASVSRDFLVQALCDA